MTASVISIAGITFSLIPEGSDSPFSLAAAYQPFTCKTPVEPPGGTYRIAAPDAPRLAALAKPPFWSNEIWRMGETDSGVGIEIFDVIRSRWVPVANLEHDFSSGTIQPFYGRRADPAPHALNYPYDQAILINRLLHKNVMVIHGAGIVYEGQGYLFFGPSGIGKTTISRLWVSRGATLLNDDRVAIYWSGKEWRVAGTPWHGEEPVVNPASAPLRAVVRLRQAPLNQLRLLNPIESMTELLSCALAPFFSKKGISHSMDILASMLEQVTGAELSLRPEQAALDHFLGALEDHQQ